jgi:hypothetical protein
LHSIYADLVNKGVVDLTPYCKEEYKEYVDTEDGEEMITRVTLELVSGQQPVFIASRYRGDSLEESHFYYSDEKSQLKDLMGTWLNKI